MLLCKPLPFLTLSEWGKCFDLIRHGGQKLEIMSAKHLTHHLSSGKCTELVEIEVVQTWAPPTPSPMPPA